MTTFLFHIISGQTMPVFIADQIVGPQKNVYVVTKDSENLLPNVSNTIGGAYDVIYTSAFDFDDLYSKLEKYESTVIASNNELVFNFTGGTKIQSVAFFEFASSHNHKAIYINGQNNEVITFNAGKITKTRKYTVKIPPEKYLSLSGYRLETENKIKFDQPSLDFLSIMERHYKKFYKSLQKREINIPANGSYIAYRGNETWIRLEHSEIIYLNLISDSAMFRKVTSPGFWLEYLSYLIIKNSGKFDYVYYSTKVFHNNGKNETNKNEIDILAMKGTTPYIFECKTAAVKNDEIDKLNYLRRTYFGRYVRIFIVGMSKPKEGRKEKIRDNNITFIPFPKLAEYIKNFTFEENPSLK